MLLRSDYTIRLMRTTDYAAISEICRVVYPRGTPYTAEDLAYPAGMPPTAPSSSRFTFDRNVFQATDRRVARDRRQLVTGSHAKVRTAREQSGFKAGLRRREKSGLGRGEEAPAHLQVRTASSPIGHVGTASSRRDERRQPEKAPLYKVVAEHLEGWLKTRAVAEQPVLAHVERDLRLYLTCGILCFGFGRARCASCGQGFVVAFSCKGRGVCPSCNGRRMAQTAPRFVGCAAFSLTGPTQSQPSRGSSAKRSSGCFVLRRA